MLETTISGVLHDELRDRELDSEAVGWVAAVKLYYETVNSCAVTGAGSSGKGRDPDAA
jgi:hypothetical protein